MWIHILARHTGLAITDRPFPPYPVDGDLEADGFGNVAGVFYIILYAAAEFPFHLAVLLRYGVALFALGELERVALCGIAHHRSPSSRLPIELFGSEGD